MLDSEDFDQNNKKVEKEQEIYKRISLLGSGSFGKAYLVKHIQEDTNYVIKQLNMADMSPQEQETALREAKILEALNHPNIVKFKEVYRTSKMKLNIVMQYADGGDLSAKIKQAKQQAKYFQESDILNWFTQICLAVKHIHDRKIIHRDLKGQNIFLTQDSCVKIGDFGVATVLQKTVSKAKTVVGSPYYLSPQIISNQPYSFKTDIWSLGAILFQMCSLTPPFTANNLQFLALKIVKGSYSNIPSHYSLQLRNLIKSCLNTNANLRPNINGILTSRVISNRIKKFLTQSQKLHEFSHTVLHNRNVFGTNKENQSENRQVNDLRPPPNLRKQNQKDQDRYTVENSSHITVPQRSPQSMNNFFKPPKTGQINKKGPNNFFNRPMSNRQKNHCRNDLMDLINIKPKAVEHQQKVEKVKLPIVSPPVVLNRKKIETHKIVPRKSSVQKVKNSAEVKINIQKKRESVPINIVHKEKQLKQLKQPQTPKSGLSQRKKQVQIKKTNVSTHLNNGKKNQTTNLNKKPNTSHSKIQKIEIKNVAEKKESKNQTSAMLNKNDSNSNKGFKKSKSIIEHKKQQSKQVKQGIIQIVSEQFKKKVNEVKSNSLSKKTNNFKCKPPKAAKKSQSKRQITQQEKINSEAQLQKYQNQSFEPYQAQDEEYPDQISLDLSQSQQVSPRMINQVKRPFFEMLSEMQQINKYVQMAQGAAANLPIFGQQLPQVFILSDPRGMRQDDIEMDTTNLDLKRINELASQIDAQESIMKTVENIDLGCFQDHNNLESLRMNLQDIFGVQHLIQAYQIIDETIRKDCLQFNQQEVIRKILRINNQIDEILLRKYFRLIVTVIAMQQQLILGGDKQ